MDTTQEYVLKSHGPVFRLEAKTGAAIEKSRASAQHEGEPLYALRMVRLLHKSEHTQTASERFSPFGAPEPVRMWMTRADKSELRARVQKAVEAGTIPADSMIRLDGGTLNEALARRVLGIGGGRLASEGERLVKGAYEAHARNPRTTAPDLRKAASELDALAERLRDPDER